MVVRVPRHYFLWVCEVQAVVWNQFKFVCLKIQLFQKTRERVVVVAVVVAVVVGDDVGVWCVISVAVVVFDFVTWSLMFLLSFLGIFVVVVKANGI